MRNGSPAEALDRMLKSARQPTLVEQLPVMIAAADAEWPPEYESNS